MLSSLKIHATQVAITDAGHIQYDPPYFEPQEENLLEEYPIDKEHSRHSARSLHHPHPDYDEILKDSREIKEAKANEYARQGVVYKPYKNINCVKVEYTFEERVLHSAFYQYKNALDASRTLKE
jgi:hypothetical protein